MSTPERPVVPARVRWQGVLWATACVALAFCGAGAWRYAVLRENLAHVDASLASLQRARMDLSQGFLHLSLSAGPLAPFDRVQGETLVRQGIETVDAVAADARFAPAASGAVRQIVGMFRDEMSRRDDGSPEAAARRQVAWRVLEHEVHRFADRGEAFRRRAIARRDAELAVTLTLAAVLVSATATGGLMAARVRRARRALVRETEQRWLLAIDGAGHGVWEYDLVAGTAYRSVQLKALMGYSGQDEQWDERQPWSSRVHPDDKPAFEAAVEAHVSGVAPKFRSEYRIRCRDGTYLWVLAQGIAVERDSSGRATRMVGTITDISEMRRITTELEEHRQLLEARVDERTAELREANEDLARRAAVIADLYNNVPCGYHSIDETGLIVAINDTELEWLGLGRNEVVGSLRFRDLVAPDDVARVDLALTQLLRDGEVRDVEFDLLRRDGSRMAVIVSATAMRDAQGRFVQSRSTMFDNRERQQRARVIDALNAELQRRAAEAEAANRAKSAFLANMSHEIRTPMNAIIGLTHLLQRDTREPGQLERLDRVADAADHLLSVINDILDLSKIEAGHLSLAQEPLDLEAIAGNVAHMIAARAEAKGIEIVVEIDHALRGRISGDPVRLSQALLNYAGNAVKFTEQGVIALRLRCVEEDDSGVMVRFEVEDTGIGIEARHHERLFRAFEQADNSTTRHYGGTGLGLAINARLAQLMGGEVGVESAPAVGSLFWMTARLRRLPDPGRSADRPDLRDARALVIDSQPRASRAIAAMLEALGAKVDVAKAMPQREEDAPCRHDLVLLDCRVIPRDSPDDPRRRAVLPVSDPARVFLTSPAAHGAVRETARELGLAGALEKPVLPSHLEAVLRERSSSGGAPVSGPIRAVPEPRSFARALVGKRVLLVEDNPINQEVSTALLEDVGLLVDLAHDGEEAVRAATARIYDCVLMDVQMPVMDGLSATRAIRKLPGWEAVPIMAMTANAFSEDRALCLAAGMSDHLGKPVDPEKLYERLLRWLAPGKPDDPSSEARDAPAVDASGGPSPLPGVDDAAGLRFAGGRREVFRRRLLRFARSPSSDPAVLDAALREARVEDARRWAHSLKGMCGFIGADRLRGLAASLEHALRSDGALSQEGEDLRRALSNGLSALRQAIEVSAEVEAASAAGHASVMLKALGELLAQDDVRANRVLRDSRDVLQEALGERFTRLEAEVARFDYAAALSTLIAARDAG